MVRAFQTFAQERQLKNLTSGLTIQSSKDFSPEKGDADYVDGSDAPWIRRFSKEGGRVIISGDTNMLARPHERLALLEEGMIVFFFGKQWANWNFFRKCSLLLHWWPNVARCAKRAKPGTFWRIAAIYKEKGRLQSIPTDDQKLVRIERQRAAQDKVATARKAKKTAENAAPRFDFWEANNSSQTKLAKPAAKTKQRGKARRRKADA